MLSTPMNCISTVDDNGHFTVIHFDGLRQETLKDIVNALEKSYDYIRKFFRAPVINIPIFVFPDMHSFHLFVLGHDGETWLVGFGGRNGIKIVNPDVAHSYGMAREDIIKVVVHEMIHVFENLYGHSKIPVMSEGIALYFAEQKNINSIKTAIKNINEISEHLFKTQSCNELGGVRGAYSLAYTVIEYILENYGEEKLQLYFLSQSKEPFEILGTKEKEFIEGWKEYVRKIYD